MPTQRMKLFSLLIGNSSPSEVDIVSPQETEMSSTSSPSTTAQFSPPLESASESEHSIDPPSPHYSINLDRLRRIFQALSSLNQNKATEAEVDEEPLQMRRKYLGIFERFEKKFGNRNGADSNSSKRRPLQSQKDRLMAFIHRKNVSSDDQDENKSKSSWAKNNLNRLTTSMRRVKSDSFLSKRRRKRKRRKRDLEESEQIRLPSMKTKKRSTVTHSRKLITTASRTAHTDLIQNLQQANSSQHCLDDIDFWDFEYPFENLVFEGGGAKVHTYIGAIKCLEEAGIKPKRLAGTSAGAITAGLLAVGYTSEEIHILYEYDVEYNVKDGTCGLLSLLPNMFRHYGWNPGERATRWFGECLAVKTRNPDITFQEVLDIYGVELCIVAVNLSTRCEEYFHPKTTPSMPIKLAARMSSSLPGYFQPVKQGTSVYIDGGLLCNYPVHVFDGWWLSMDKDDVFYKKMGSLDNLPSLMERKNRFGGYNQKTLGFCMYSMFDDKALRFELEKRHKINVTDRQRPETKLAMKRSKMMKERDQRVETRDAKLDALSRFFKVLRKCHVASGDDCLKKSELIAQFQQLLEESSDSDGERLFTKTHVDVIFGPNTDLISLLEDIHAESSDKVSSTDLIAFLNKNNVDLHAILGQQYLLRTQVHTFGSFFMTIQESLMNSARRVYIQTEDLDRTVGINTDYIKMDDFSLEREDQEFLIQQGYKATAAFLRYYIHQNKMRKCDPSSHTSSELSADDSDYSPVHVHKSDSNTDLSDDEYNRQTTSSSKASSSTESPSKCLNTPISPPHSFEVHSDSNIHSSTDDEVIVATIEVAPSVDLTDDLQTMQSLALCDHESSQKSPSLKLPHDICA
ncbi:uncharacterized protein [Watersipora subatra]|uniref:uncharacterized protein n=1 Tax=Watersipora subatra TaxID=2589382 RepID=UPI00355C1125